MDKAEIKKLIEPFEFKKIPERLAGKSASKENKYYLLESELIDLLQQYAKQEDREAWKAWKAGRDFGVGKTDKNFNDWKSKQQNNG